MTRVPGSVRVPDQGIKLLVRRQLTDCFAESEHDDAPIALIERYRRMNDLEQRLFEAMVDCVLAKSARKAKKEERAKADAASEDTSNLDRELKTLKDGLKATKMERNRLLEEWLRIRDEVK
jgi:hypothetical protein